MRGLLGKKLSHSFSKRIHEKIDGLPYDLIEVDNLDPFFNEKAFQALNITIPYKNDVVKYLDFKDHIVENTNVCNTIIKKDNKLYGYNTDYYGFEFMLSKKGIVPENKVVGIIGNGSTSRTVQLYFKNNNAKKIYVFARNPKDTEIQLDTMNEFNDIEILVNTTPVGTYMFPVQSVGVRFDLLKNVEYVVDVVYNPLKTKLLIDAENHHISTVNGLMMLVHQAVKANNLFHDISHPDSLSIDIYKEILLETLNIVLIGMPMSGKSYYSRQISSLYNKDLFDIDTEIENFKGKPIPEIFQEDGEIEFRNIETMMCENLSKEGNKAISTGGGVILNKQNIDYLKQNGIIIFLDMSLNELKRCNPKGRPLLKDPKNLEKLYQDRYDLYQSYADKRVVKRGFKQKVNLQKIEVKINEYINSQWSKS